MVIKKRFSEYNVWFDIMVEDSDRGYGRTANKSTLLKIVILGEGGVGKSCLMSRFISNHFDDHSFHTIGVEFMNKTIEVNGKPYTLQVISFNNCINKFIYSLLIIKIRSRHCSRLKIVTSFIILSPA